MSAAGTEPNAGVWLPKGNPWIIAIAVSLAAFMEVLDTSIAKLAKTEHERRHELIWEI